MADNESIQISSLRALTKCFKPANSVDKPVPPPIATSFRLPLAFAFCNYFSSGDKRSGEFERE